MALISIGGRLNSGKDTVGMIIQALTSKDAWSLNPVDYVEAYKGRPNLKGGFQIRKFAGVLKKIASMLTGIPAEAFEDQKFKERDLDGQWSYWTVAGEGRFGSQLEAAMSIADKQGTSIKEVDQSVITCHKMKTRQFLQELGTDAIRNNLHPQSWINAAFVEYSEKCDWIFTDTRFPNEMKAIADRGGITIRVKRPNKETDYHSLHPSETALDSYKFDYEIINDGTLAELVDKVRVVLADIAKKQVILT